MKVMLAASDRGELSGFDDGFVKVVTGVGPILASASAMKAAIENKPDIIISIGSAGAIAGGLEIGKAYSFGKIVTPDQDLTSFHLALGSTLDPKRATLGMLSTMDRGSSLILATSGRFASEITAQHKSLKADAADMEACGVCMAASMLAIPFFAVKLITDYVGDKSTIGKVSFNLREGRAALSSAVASIIK